MAFRNIRFPIDISFGAIGGPRFRTDIAQVESGHEARNEGWTQELGNWEVGHNARLPEKYRRLQKHFRIMHGRAHSFPFKDWTDFEVGAGEGILVELTPTTFQLYKRYLLGDPDASPLIDYYDRKIMLPIESIMMTGGTVSSIDYTTGIVTMSSGTPTAWTGEFDCLARYDIDQMRAETIDRSGRNGELIVGWAGIPIVELRSP